MAKMAKMAKMAQRLLSLGAEAADLGVKAAAVVYQLTGSLYIIASTLLQPPHFLG